MENPHPKGVAFVIRVVYVTEVLGAEIAAQKASSNVVREAWKNTREGNSSVAVKAATVNNTDTAYAGKVDPSMACQHTVLENIVTKYTTTKHTAFYPNWAV